MQRIEVKDFGPLKNINLEIKDYMVFIGPQASGKSTLAKLIYFFWKVEDKFREEILSRYIVNLLEGKQREVINPIETFKTDVRKILNEFFPTIRDGEFSFTYNDGYSITIKLNWSYNKKDEILIGEGFLNEILQVNKRIQDSPALTKLLQEQKLGLNSLLEILSAEFLSDTKNILSQFPNSEKVFIPAGRSILSLLSNLVTFIESNNLDYYNESFVKFINKIKWTIGSMDHMDLFGKELRETLNAENKYSYLQHANVLSYKILKGEFKVGDNMDAIRQYRSDFVDLIPLKYTSSGQQEAAWLINTIQYLLVQKHNFDVIIEEPEAHLFPDAQREMTKLITLLNSADSENKTRLIVTTHSPYILATLNNSVKAFTTAQIENKADDVEKILSKNFWVNPENLFVGFMNKNEEEDNFGIEDIFNQELGLIDHEVLDKVSDDIMKQFDELLDIQYSE